MVVLLKASMIKIYCTVREGEVLMSREVVGDVEEFNTGKRSCPAAMNNIMVYGLD